MRLKTLFALILCNFIWAANPAVAKVLLRDFSAAHVAWLRYSSALLGYFAVFAMRGKRISFFVPRMLQDWLWLFLLAGMTFIFSPLTQVTGLAASTATDNALIIAMEPLVTVLLAALILKERIRRHEFIAFGLAIFGFALLTQLTPSRLIFGFDSRLTGNLLILVALIGEALYSVLGRKLTVRNSASGVFASALTLGVIGLTGVVFLRFGLPPFGKISPIDFAAVLWLGPLGTAATYLFWMSVLQSASIPAITLTLFVQPIFGSFLGWFFLHETLTFLQACGGAFILLSLLICSSA